VDKTGHDLCVTGASLVKIGDWLLAKAGLPVHVAVDRP